MYGALFNMFYLTFIVAYTWLRKGYQLLHDLWNKANKQTEQTQTHRNRSKMGGYQREVGMRMSKKR